MNAYEKAAVRKLLTQARRQIRHHGHLCGYGNDRTKHSACKFCTPTAQAIREVSEFLSLDSWSIRFLHEIGLKTLKDIFEPVVETEDAAPKHIRQKVFIKFMSNEGKRDKEQGQQFEKWLQNKHLLYSRFDERKFSLPLVALELALGFQFPAELFG